MTKAQHLTRRKNPRRRDAYDINEETMKDQYDDQTYEIPNLMKHHYGVKKCDRSNDQASTNGEAPENSEIKRGEPKPQT